MENTQVRKQQIRNRWTGAVLFECEIPAHVESGLAMRHALETAAAKRPRINLSGADLRDANLRDADLRDADLRGADLRDADLSDAVLSGADLRGAVLSDAVLSDAVLSDAVLSDAVLSDADLRGADLRDADLRDANLRDADLRDADLRDADLRAADLRDADLPDANLRDADLRDADLRDADLRGADLRDADLPDADGNPLPRATPEQAIENLDKVREIILDNKERLDMGHWHADDGWKERTCAEETLCGTTHCMAGWLQVCSTEPALKDVEAYVAGVCAAPIAAKMFYRGQAEALNWLETRAYVAETEERARRDAERAARKAAAASAA